MPDQSRILATAVFSDRARRAAEEAARPDSLLGGYVELIFGPVHRLFIRSAAERVLHQTECPVLLVPSKG